VGSALAAFAAAAGPTVRAGRGPILRVLVHDASASRGARALPDEDEIAALLDGLGERDRVAAVSFGARVVDPVGDCAPSEFRARLRDEPRTWRAIDPDDSSLFAALREAAHPRLTHPGRDFWPHGLEIVLATDALATDASRDALENTVLCLAKEDCALLRVLRRKPIELPSVVSELRGPGAARVGEPFTLDARGVAKTDDALVEFSDASGVLETRRVRGTGPFRLAFTRIEEKAGPASFTARVVGTTDVPAPTARVVATSPGRALVVGAARREIAGLDATWRDARDLNSTDASSAFDAADVVVLDDLPSGSIDAFGEALERYVARGGGVTMFGGPRSFGAGGWAGRGIEKLSPLVARPKDEAGVFLYVALDGSGSMAEPWSDAPGAATRDDVVRAAAQRLVLSAADDTTIAVRRFAEGLKPSGVPVVGYRLDEGGRGALPDVIGVLASPGGPTALLPPLREALSLAASQSEKRKRALILTDGRTPERAEDLHAALVALDAAKVGVMFVLPGDAALDDEAHALKEALVGTHAEVRGATTPSLLADVFRDVEEKSRVDEPVVTDRRLAVDAGAAPLIDAVPEFAARVDRTWLADGARRLVVTDKGEPVAAIRRVGLGRVTALATRPGDADWLAAGEKTSRLVASLVRAAMRPAAGRMRVERDGETRLLVRYDAPPGGAVAAFVECDGSTGRVRAPLVSSGGGILAAEVPAAGREAPDWIDVLAADGRVLATAGLDTPAPAEYRDPPPVDLDALAALATTHAAPPVSPLAPWLAATAVALALAAIAVAGIKSEPHRAR
jgi:hypothetical protein